MNHLTGVDEAWGSFTATMGRESSTLEQMAYGQARAISAIADILEPLRPVIKAMAEKMADELEKETARGRR